MAEQKRRLGKHAEYTREVSEEQNARDVARHLDNNREDKMCHAIEFMAEHTTSDAEKAKLKAMAAASKCDVDID